MVSWPGRSPEPRAATSRTSASGQLACYPVSFHKHVRGHDVCFPANLDGSRGVDATQLPALVPGGEAGDVLAGVDMLIATGVADLRAMFLLGHSYGGYLAGRIVTRDHRFRAAACCETVADLRILDAVNQQVQAAWLGGDARQSPGRWAAASPAEYAQDIRTPMLLVYAADSGLTVQGEAWHTAL